MKIRKFEQYIDDIFSKEDTEDVKEIEDVDMSEPELKKEEELEEEESMEKEEEEKIWCDENIVEGFNSFFKKKKSI